VLEIKIKAGKLPGFFYCATIQPSARHEQMHCKHQTDMLDKLPIITVWGAYHIYEVRTDGHRRKMAEEMGAGKIFQSL
jgi:hypothetical protein